MANIDRLKKVKCSSFSLGQGAVELQEDGSYIVTTRIPLPRIFIEDCLKDFDGDIMEHKSLQDVPFLITKYYLNAWQTE